MSENYNPNYRSDIDGLRAISVIGVILFHLKYVLESGSVLKGGFFGVDIFFVISGYLITYLILKEIKSTENFSIINFFKRRIRRILPVLMVVILSIIPLAYIIYLPTELISFSKSILYSIGMISNYFFLLINAEYFAPEIVFQSLLHTWSLGIEEQFYIIFPFLISIIYLKNKNNFIFIFLIFFFISLIGARIGTIHHKNDIFYITLFRIFEFIPGSILAYMEVEKGKNLKNNFVEKVLPILGFILILISFIYFDDKTRHPSFETLLPILGACLIIWYNNYKNNFYKLISNKFFVYIGLISFSLYLWHFPIFTFVAILDLPKDEIYKEIFLISLTIPLSILTYHLVEKKFRNKKISFTNVMIFIFVLFLIIILFSLKSITSQGFMDRYKITDNYNLDPKHDSDLRKKYLKDYYEKNHLSGKEKILVIGNSHAEDNINILSRNSYVNENFFLVKPKGGQVYDFWKFLENCIDCENINKNEYKNLYKNSKKIILATRWYEKDLEVLDNILDKLKSDKKEVLIIDNSLIFNQRTKYNLNELDYFVFKNKRMPNDNEITYLEKNTFKQLKNSEKINQTIKKIGEKHNVKILHKKDLLCDNDLQSCKIITSSGKKVYLDYHHLTNDGANFISSKKLINFIFW